MKKFIAQYGLSKTLRFELKPVGRTLENIQKKGLLTQDENLAESYRKMKETIDAYHREFIEKTLSKTTLTYEHLQKLVQLYHTPKTERNDTYKKSIEQTQYELRKEIVDSFTSGEMKEVYSKLFQKDLISKLLQNWVKEKQEKGNNLYFDKNFEKFTTYFTGFHENRKNIYTNEAQSTAIAYRLIHQNLAKFAENIRIFEKVKQHIEYKFPEIAQAFNLTEEELCNLFVLSHYNHLLTQKGIEHFNQVIGGYTLESGRKIQGLSEHINLYNQGQKDKKDHIPKLKILYKQILSDRQSTSFLPSKFSNSQEVLGAVRDYYLSNLICYIPEGKQEAENILEKIQWDSQTIQLTQAMQNLLNRYDIPYKNGNDISEHLAQQRTKEFFKELIHIFKLTLQMRNSIPNTEIDYLISPVMNNKNEFFDTRKADNTLPKDADANGAYHIAKKGLMWLEQIQKHYAKGKKLDLDKTNKGWLQFVQNHTTNN